ELGFPGLEEEPRGVAPARFPPSVVVAVKALVCELPHRCALPLSRWSLADIQREVVAEGIVAQVSGTTLWRWLSREGAVPVALPKLDLSARPQFAAKAGRVLDLYQGRWEGAPLGRRDFVLSADEKTSIQARIHIHHSLPAAPAVAPASSTSTNAAVPARTWP